MLRVLIAAWLALLTVAPAAGRQTTSLDAYLRFDAFLRARGADAALPHAVPRPGEIRELAARPAVLDDALPVLVQAEPAALAALEAAGARVRTRVGSIASVTLPLAQLDRIGRMADIRHIETAASLVLPAPFAAAARPATSPFRLDRAVDALRADDAAEESGVAHLRQQRPARFVGLAGRGVLVGVYDTGLDLEHPDFRGPDGGSRVVYAWDQAAASGPAPGAVGPHTFDYGRECTQADIDGGACPLRDTHGHGTHVAGVATGAGRARPDGRFAGVAPEADLIIVRGGEGVFTSDRLLDGVAYMVQRAAELGRPLVINLSVASSSGPHDGTTLFEQALDLLSGPGRVIVTGAGNTGDNRNESPPFARQSLHATSAATGAAPGRHELLVPPYVPAPGDFTDAVLLEAWYSGADTLTVVVTTPGGDVVAGAFGDTTVAFTSAGAVYIDNAAAGASPLNGDHGVLIAFFDAEAALPPATGRWTIEFVRAGGAAAVPYHLWLVASTVQNPTQPITLAVGTTNTHLVTVPGTATRLLTVAAHSTRFSWPGAGGALQTFPFREELGDLAHFSAPGPRRDGVFKPELSAPGKLLLAPRSRDARLWDDLAWMIDATGHYAALLGTSVSAPYTAGTVALLLERNPQLDPESARALLAGNARSDAFTGRGYQTQPAPVPNIHWGAGKLDAAAAVYALGHAAGSLGVDVVAAPGETRVNTAAGQRIPLLHFTLSADSVEPMQLARIALQLAGQDTAARLLLIVDGGADDGRVVLERGVRLAGETGLVLAPGPMLERAESRAYALLLEVSGTAPHGARYSARFLPETSVVRGVLSGTVSAATGPTVIAIDREADILPEGSRWAISENPVRSGRLVLTFDEPPRRAAIYSLAGALVADLTARAEAAPVSIVWNLENQRGTTVAPGVYLLVIDFPQERVLRRLFLMPAR